MLTRIVGALVLGLTLGLTACGVSGIGGVGAANGTPTAAGGNCGAVATGPRPVQNTPAAVGVERCFAAAFAQCRPATLLFTAGSIDTITTHALAVAPAASGCRITDTRRTTLVGSDHNGPTTVLTCTAATQEASGLHLSGCQNGEDFTVAGTSGPTPALSPVPSA